MAKKQVRFDLPAPTSRPEGTKARVRTSNSSRGAGGTPQIRTPGELLVAAGVMALAGALEEKGETKKKSSSRSWPNADKTKSSSPYRANIGGREYGKAPPPPPSSKNRRDEQSDGLFEWVKVRKRRTSYWM